MVVDDEKIIRNVCQQSLQKINFLVDCAENGLTALDLIRQNDDIAIVLSDLRMPGKDGIELLKDIKRDHSHIEVIMMTGYGTIEAAIEAMKIGAFDFMIKPLKPDQIRMVVKKCDEKIQASDTIKGLREANERLRHLEVRKGKFLAITSHELRTPVSHLKGYLDILADDIYEAMTQKERSECLRVMRTAVNDLEEIVTNMFDILRHENMELPLSKEEVDIHEILREIYSEFRTVSKHGGRHHNIRLELKAQNHVLVADRLRVKVLVSHLIQNAKKFTPDSGEIIIRSFNESKFLAVCVKDNGIGIPEKEFGNIFTEFYELRNTDHHTTSKTDFKGGGVGLGLPLARAIARAHKGGMRVNSKVDFGSSFYVYLPATKDANLEDIPDIIH
ncbi:MAG: response regulator [bacterium]